MAFVDGAHNVYGDHSYLDAGAPSHHHHQHYAHPSMHDPAGFYGNPNVAQPNSMACDIKPRLTKEQHDILESHYQKQSKPNTNTKKGFAETLNVSLDKVNNWFQNRRAKAKQDIKKQAGAYNIFAQQQPCSLSMGSDSESSPAFTSPEYYSMMQQCTSADDQMPNNLSMSDLSRFQEQSPNGLPFTTGSGDQFSNGHMSQQTSGGFFDSPQDLNRRTLTQEQFDAFAQNGGVMQSGQFDTLQQGFSGDADVLHQVFPDMQNDDYKPQDSFAFPAPIGAPLSSNDSSVPSTISEQSMFPSSTSMQEQAAASRPPSEWADSRSSSVSVAPSQDSSYQQASAAQQQPTMTSSQWQPGQSVPVDPNDLQQQFREAQRQAQQQQQHHQEQPLAWPADEAFVRRDSQNGTMLAQQMSSFAIQTPQPQQTATFKCPAPPDEANGGIAARRQRPRPAALGLASLRSQSYSGAVQPASPSHATQTLAPNGQQIRRIRSSVNVINGVAQGRVMKSGTGSAQRSPLSFTFADSLNSPKAARHASTPAVNTLAPPTPMSPSEMPIPTQDQSRPQFPPWQSSNGHFSRHASISETDVEHQMSMMSGGTIRQQQQQNVSSPPHTPMYHHHQQYPQHFASARVGNNVITENTPPQSAPAVQQSFPADVFMLPQQHAASNQPSFMSQQQQQFMNASISEPQFQIPTTYGSGQHLALMPPEAQQMSMHFANGGVPIVNPQGQLVIGFPSQMQYVQNAPSQGQGDHYNFMTQNGNASGAQITAQMPKQQSQPATEFFVHEYTPPQEIKRSATQRKVTNDAGPKNYTFANQGPEHFEKEKAKKNQDAKAGTADSSPASASSSS